MRNRIISAVHRLRERFREIATIGPAIRVIAAELLRSANRGLRALLSDVIRRDRPIRVGVDIRPFYEPLTGVGWYLHEILGQLASTNDVELVAFGDPRVSDDGPHLHVELPASVDYRIFDLTGRPSSRYTRAMTSAAQPLMIRLERIDLFFGGNYFLPGPIDAVAETRVVTVHDLTYRKRPDLLQAETLANLETRMLRELARADAVICVSRATRNDLLEEYEIDASRVIAVQNGMTLRKSEKAGGSLDLPQRYVLFVSTIEPRKDLDILIDAFERLRDREAYEGDLVVAGRIGWKAEQTAERLTSSRWSNAIHHLDYVPREHLDEIYRRAEVFVLPSLYEGFGFPILEAMSHHVPVITTNVSSLPEVGGDAALYFEPGDVDALATAISRIASSSDLREQIVERGLEQVKKFDWGRAARETMDVFERVVNR